MKKKNILAIIPARGGSKTILRKNVYMLAGRPLIEYTLEAVKGSTLITHTIVSTDDEDIANVARSNGVDVPFMRPPELAQDDTPMLPVVEHVLDLFEKKEKCVPEIVVILQPTSPLRNAQHIDEAIQVMLDTNADTVVSVVAVPHQYNPLSVMAMDNGRLVPYLKGEGTRLLRKQDKPPVYARNGAAVYVVKTDTIRSRQTLFGVEVRPYIMNINDSIDIDTKDDVEFAEFLLTRM